jgi:hypothetical protein
MKKLIGALLVSLAVLMSCDSVGTIFNPLIGTWEMTVLGVKTTLVFHTDKTCTEATTVADVVGVSKAGTWTSDSSTVTRTWSDASTDTYSYSFNSDKSSLTLSPSAGILMVYSRM